MFFTYVLNTLKHVLWIWNAESGVVMVTENVCSFFFMVSFLANSANSSLLVYSNVLAMFALNTWSMFTDVDFLFF